MAIFLVLEQKYRSKKRSIECAVRSFTWNEGMLLERNTIYVI